MATTLVLVLRKRQDLKWVNAIAFIVAGYSTVPGIIHLAYYTEARLVHPFAVWPWLTGGILYAVGAIIYALNVPERFVKKTFDIWLQSHSIFHWMILAAAMLHFWASLRVFHQRQVSPCPDEGVIPTVEG